MFPGIEPVAKGSNRRRKADGSTLVMCNAHNEPRWRSIPAQTAIIFILNILTVRFFVLL